MPRRSESGTGAAGVAGQACCAHGAFVAAVVAVKAVIVVVETVGLVIAFVQKAELKPQGDGRTVAHDAVVWNALVRSSMTLNAVFKTAVVVDATAVNGRSRNA